jgi:hypothetical protein
MQEHRFKATVDQSGAITLKDLPFEAGDQVEVTIVAERRRPSSEDAYPLRGTPVTLTDPYEPVADEDWESVR